MAKEDNAGSHVARADEADFAGVRYFARHDSAQKLLRDPLFGGRPATAPDRLERDRAQHVRCVSVGGDGDSR